MRILHVISSLSPEGGGTTEAVRLLHDSLIFEGHESEALCCGDPNEEWVQSWKGLVHVLGVGKYGWAYHPGWMPWLKQNAKRFDKIIIHGLWLYPSYVVRSALNDLAKAGEAAPPFFIFSHGMLDPWFQKAKERRVKAIRNWLYWKLIENKSVKSAAGLLFTCEQELRLARTTFQPYQPQQELNVGYGIAAPPQFHSKMKSAFEEKCPGLNGRSYLLFLSRIHPKKGVDDLIRAYGQLAKKLEVEGKSKLPVLVIAGPGLDTGYGEEMRRLVSEYCDADSVIFPGMLSGDAKWGAFYGCDAFILPSHQENFGIAVVEALACSRPVLISTEVNIWREIESNEAGLVESDGLAGTSRLLEGFMNMSASSRQLMGAAAGACYEANYQTQQMVKKLLAVLT